MPNFRRLSSALFALIVATGTLVSIATPASAITGPTRLWNNSYPDHIVESSPNVINAGGQPTAFVGSHNGNMYGLRSDGSAAPGWPFYTGDGIDSSPSGADVDGDGHSDIFFGSGTPAVHSGNLWSVSDAGQQRWKFHPSDQDDANISVFSSPAIGDVNYDGTADVSGFTLGLHGWSLNARSGGTNSGWHVFQDDSIFSSPALADVDGDGVTDYIVGGDSAPGAVVDHRGGVVRAFRGDGSVIWQFLTDDIVRSSPAVGDVDGDGQNEIVFGTGDYWVRQPGGAHDSSKLWVLNANGSLQWVKDLGGYTLASPALADLNGDGRLDIVEGTWEGGNPGKVFAFDGASSNPLPNWNNKNSGGGVVIGQVSTADFDGDGGQDVMVPTGGGIFVYSGKTGAQLFTMEEGQVAYQNSPWVGDMDNDGRLDIILAGTKNGNGQISRWEMPNTTANLGSLGWSQFRKDSRLTGSWADAPLARDRCSDNPGDSYVMAASDGGIFTYCTQFKGSMGGQRLNAPIVGLARHPDQNGYWLVASDGGIFNFGSADFYGSAGSIRLNKPIVGMAATPSGRGYWLVASDGGIFNYGDADFYGSAGWMKLNSPIVGMASTSSGHGYYLVGADGGIFTYGDADYKGSMGGSKLNKPIVGMASSSNGYWFVASDGGIFNYGNADYKGSMGGSKINAPVVGMSKRPVGNGYRLVGTDGGLFSFEAPFLGSAANYRLVKPIVAIG